MCYKQLLIFRPSSSQNTHYGLPWLSTFLCAMIPWRSLPPPCFLFQQPSGPGKKLLFWGVGGLGGNGMGRGGVWGGKRGGEGGGVITRLLPTLFWAALILLRSKQCKYSEPELSGKCLWDILWVVVVLFCKNILTIVGFQMTSLKFKLQNYQSYRDFTFMVY